MIKPFVVSAVLAWAALTAPAQFRISEFMAENDGFLHDADGESPDWIEIQNGSASSQSLAGWHLTDSATNLAKWTFPATNLPAGGSLVVFASGKDRAVAGAELHANFQLNNAGQYLALVRPDGVTVEHAYAPAFPPQRANVSYGIGREVVSASLISTGALARWLVPTNGALGLAWTAAGFNDAAWSNASTGLGYESAGVTNAGGVTLLSLDFNKRATDPATNTLAGFTSFLITSNVTSATIQTSATVRVFGGLTVTLSNTAPNGYDDRLRTTPNNSGAFTEALLLRDFVFSRSISDAGGLDLTVAGLPASQVLAVTVWSYDSGSPGARISDWSANGSSVRSSYTFDGSVLPASNEAYRINFTTTTSSNGQFLLSGRRNSASAAAAPAVFINALQITQPGFGTLIAMDLRAAMSNRNASVFIRLPFTVTDPSAVQTMKLRMKYDDGFVAFINGQLVASNNAPASLQWNSAATAAHPNGGAAYEDFNFAVPAGLLVSGANVLAIQGLNVSASDADFLILPELQGVSVNEYAGRYFKPATPGAPNDAGCVGLVADTKFSVNRGFFDAPFSLSITCATAGAEIWFTTNGSAPAPGNGWLFTTPISITGQSFIRAAAFLAGYVPSDIDTHSYLFLRDVLRQSNNIPGYPTNWTQASYPADYALDPAIVNHPVYGATISNDLRSIPTLSIVSDQGGLWNSVTGIYPNPVSVGPAWERATSVELIRGDGKTEFATTCKMQMHGNASRDNQRTPKHALGLSFNSDYGPSKLRYDWFGGGVDVQDKIVLRGCGFVDGWAGRYADDLLYTSTETGEVFRGLRYRPENTCYLRDAWVKDSFRAMGGNASRSQYVHLYINGLYWGLYEPSEHIDASYFALLHGGTEGAWDVLVGEDNNGPPVIVEGAGVDWTNVLGIVNAGITNEAAYQAVAQLVDVDNLIDYMMVHIFAESEDWPRHNWYLAHRRATNGLPATKFVCTVWDQELTLDRLVRRNRVEVGTTGGEVYGPARVYAQLRAWPEFRLRFGDRVQKHLFNGGALTPSNNVARLLAPAAIIRDALTGESARWGDARKFPTPGNTNGTGQTFTRNEWWQPEIDKLATNFFQTLTATNIARLRAGNLYPALSAPEFGQFGGGVPAGFALAMSHTNATGTIFFTLDGSDPRAYGTGAVTPTASAYDAPVPLNSPTLVRARVLSAGQWSALVEAMFYPPQDLSKLALTEIMYNPEALDGYSGDYYEFLELKNTGTNTLNLSGLMFTSGISFTFTNGTLLVPGQFLVLVPAANRFSAKYPGVTIAGVYLGRLDNGGERITLSHPLGGTIFSVSYDDEAPWPAAADHIGFSLVQRNTPPSPAPDDPTKWRASARLGGSPGADDPPQLIAPILVNEVLTASTTNGLDTIELFNPTATNVDIGGWFLTDDSSEPAKYRIPDGTIIPALGYAVFDERQFNATPGTNGSFVLSARGEWVYLFSADVATNFTGYAHGFSFQAAEPGVSFGRYVNSVGEESFPAQISLSFSNANAGPRVGPVVINEIQYHPEANGDEFVELKNITAAAVPLFDPLAPTNTWRLNGLGYEFPTNITLEAQGMLLLVAINPAGFRAKYSVPTNALILGPYAGALQDSGERLTLERPAPPDPSSRAFIVVDEVRYNDRAPWPSAADGSGSSLQRMDAAAFGDDPINWLAATPTPSRDTTPLDTDGDGMPDAWEIANGTNPNVNDANADPDQDGLTNWQEYVAGTNPMDPLSSLRLQAFSTCGNAVITWEAISNRTYSVFYTDGLEPSAWLKLVDAPARATNWSAALPDPAATTNRFYRLVTPSAQ